MPDTFERLKPALSDRYAIERELGVGGMATVYLADDLKHERKVAVKVLRPELAAILGAERFLNEIKVTANLQHPHILPLHDSGEADGFLFYVMPYIEGESLRDKLNREKQLGIEETLEITKAVASAVDYAHRQGVIHRDIKPENILLHDGQPIVADFGIALAVSAAGGHRLTETGLSLGTPHYMSPEQAMGDRDVDARSDIYSLAATVYEMLVGEPPFTGPTAQSVVAKVLTEQPRNITAVRRTVPPHMNWAVHKALEKLPADRFAAASEFVTALQRPTADFVAPRAEPGLRAGAPRNPILADDVLKLTSWLSTALADRYAADTGLLEQGTPRPWSSESRYAPFPCSRNRSASRPAGSPANQGSCRSRGQFTPWQSESVGWPPHSCVPRSFRPCSWG